MVGWELRQTWSGILRARCIQEATALLDMLLVLRQGAASADVRIRHFPFDQPSVGLRWRLGAHSCSRHLLQLLQQNQIAVKSFVSQNVPGPGALKWYAGANHKPSLCFGGVTGNSLQHFFH